MGGPWGIVGGDSGGGFYYYRNRICTHSREIFSLGAIWGLNDQSYPDRVRGPKVDGLRAGVWTGRGGDPGRRSPGGRP